MTTPKTDAAPGHKVRTRSHETIELHIPSVLGWERTAMDLAGSVARRMGFLPERIEDIKTAVSEATINAMEHGNKLDAAQRVLIVLAPDPAALRITVRDHSHQPFTGPTGGDPKLDDMVAGLARSRGWGVFLIKELVDEVEFVPTARGNVVRMVIHLEPQS